MTLQNARRIKIFEKLGRKATLPNENVALRMAHFLHLQPEKSTDLGRHVTCPTVPTFSWHSTKIRWHGKEY